MDYAHFHTQDLNCKHYYQIDILHRVFIIYPHSGLKVGF